MLAKRIDTRRIKRVKSYDQGHHKGVSRKWVALYSVDWMPYVEDSLHSGTT